MWIDDVFLFTHVCGQNVSLTTYRVGLADRITIPPQCILNAFTPVIM